MKTTFYVTINIKVGNLVLRKMQNFYNLVAGSFVLCLFVIMWKALNSLYLKPKRMEKFLRAQGLNGNPYRPFRGDLNEFGRMLQEAHSKPIRISEDFLPRVIPLFVETFKKYGKNSFMWLGPKPSVFIWEPELIKEIMVNYTIFQKPHFNALTKLLAEGLVSYEGDKWVKHRKIITPAFHVEKLKHMSSAFLLSAEEMLRKWEEIISPKGSGELDIWPHLQNLSSDAISRAAFGSSYEEGKRIFELQREQADHYQIVERTILYIPGYRFLPTKRNKRMQYIKRVVEDSIRDIVDKREKAMTVGEFSNDDLLGILLESNYNEIQEQGDKKFGMTMNDVIKECKLFYYAGAETTSVLLVWTLVFLSKHQDWQSRAREEVLRVFGRNAPDFEGLNHLKAVTMILNETLRLYPPVATINRRVHKDTKIGKYSLPAGTLVTLPFILLHHDTEIWGDDAKEFNPERFADGISNATKGQVAYFPFGWGPRTCIGQNLSLVEAKLALAMILQRFSFELSGSYTHAPRRIVTLQPQHGAHLVLHKLEFGELAGSP